MVELNIGHFLVGEAIFGGLDSAIKRMRALMDKARAEAQDDAEILISALHGDGFEALLEVISGKWLDARRSAMPGQTVDPSAPFTASQVEWIEKALSALVKTPGTPLLDEVKRCLIICLQSSWPQNCASASS